MDLILVMKERLRDQSSETRLIVRWFIYLTCGGFAFLMFAFYSHPSQTWTSPRKGDDGSGPTEVVSASAPGGPSALSFTSFVVGHLLLFAAVRSVAELPRLSRGSGWSYRADVPSMQMSPQRSTASGPSPYVPKYGLEVSSVVMMIIFAEKFLPLSWIVVLQLCHLVLFGHVAYRSMAGIA